MIKSFDEIKECNTNLDKIITKNIKEINKIIEAFCDSINEDLVECFHFEMTDHKDYYNDEDITYKRHFCYSVDAVLNRSSIYNTNINIQDININYYIVTTITNELRKSGINVLNLEIGDDLEYTIDVYNVTNEDKKKLKNLYKIKDSFIIELFNCKEGYYIIGTIFFFIVLILGALNVAVALILSLLGTIIGISIICIIIKKLTDKKIRKIISDYRIRFREKYLDSYSYDMDLNALMKKYEE